MLLKLRVNKYIKQVTRVILLAVIMLPVFAAAQSYPYEIIDFNSAIEVTEEGLVEIQETITVNFNEPRRGIFRDLPYRYQDGRDSIYTEVVVDEVLQDGAPATTKETRNDSHLRIRIGDPDITITGQHVYEINYSVAGVLRPVDPQSDELYWNVTGNDWDAPIDRVVATVTLPDGVGVLEAACYRGRFNSIDDCGSEASGSTVMFQASDLGPGEGMTIAASWPAGQIPILTPDDPRELWQILVWVIPGIVLLLSSWFFYRRWEKYGQDPVMPESVVTRFSPPENLNPLLAGIVLDNRADTIDVTSTLIDLARRGYLEIEQIPGKLFGLGKDYKLRLLNEDFSNVSTSEKLLLQGIFGDVLVSKQVPNSEVSNEVLLGDLKNSFYRTLNNVKKQAEIEAYKAGLYTRSIGSLGGSWWFMVGVIAVGFISFIMLSGNTLGIVTVIGSAVAFVIPFGMYAYLSPQLTNRGAAAKHHLLGYKDFIETAEKHRARFYEDQNLFFDTMPYAVMFGLAEKFANQVKAMDVSVENPAWYQAANMGSIADFGSDINALSQELNSTMSSSPSSSGSGGGGSSGGGFGGGGGGSW